MLVTKIFGSCNDIPTLWLRRPADAEHLSETYENLGTNRSHRLRNGKHSRGFNSRARPNATSPLSIDPSSSKRHPWAFRSYPGTRTLRHRIELLVASGWRRVGSPRITTAAGGIIPVQPDR